MLAPLSSLEAFRRDTVTLIGVGQDDACAAMWLESAIRLERAAMTRGADRERLLTGFLAQHGVVPFPSTGVSTDTLVSTVVDFARTIEDSALFRLSHSVLASLLLLVPRDAHLIRGRVLAQQGRVARHLGELEAAARYYGAVESIGVEHALPELLGRAWVGLSVLAQTRGDYPQVRERLHKVINLPGAARDSIVAAHHDLMLAAAAAKDYDAAAQHAWKAFEGASNEREQTVALNDLAQLFLEAGYPQVALRGFAAVLVRQPGPRYLLPALSGAAWAAAITLPIPAARAVVRNFSKRVGDLVDSLEGGASLPWPSTSALVEISEALERIGDERAARQTAERAASLARARGFHELTYRLDNPPVVPAPAQLATVATSIIAAVDELEGAELVGLPA